MAPPFDPVLEKIGFAGAVSLALQYADAQNWSFGQEWMLDVIRESDYSVRDLKRNLHAIPLSRAYQKGHEIKLTIGSPTAYVNGKSEHWGLLPICD